MRLFGGYGDELGNELKDRPNVRWPFEIVNRSMGKVWRKVWVRMWGKYGENVAEVWKYNILS
jgi:hypothetical protein